jgi:radical SAM protein with 4Fe4S-binding SPASM domain
MARRLLIPKQIDIEVTSRCDLRCKLCPTLDPAAQVADMPFDLFRSIINRIDFPTSIVPWLNGEPLLHPDYPQMIRLLNERGLRYYTTTNGMTNRPEVYEELLAPGTGCYQIIFSLDGLDNYTQQTARPGSDYSKIVDTIRHAFALRQKSKAQTDIAVKICQRGQDYEEVQNFILRWLYETNVDFVCMGVPLVQTNPISMRRYPCRYSDQNFMVIKSDGRVTRCAYNLEATNDPNLAFGSVCNTDSLLDIYNNEAFRWFRAAQHTDMFPHPCDKCAFAYTGDGFDGVVRPRKPGYEDARPIHYHTDYYNSFFSLKEKKKGGSWSGAQARCGSCGSTFPTGERACPICGEDLE